MTGVEAGSFCLSPHSKELGPPSVSCCPQLPAILPAKLSFLAICSFYFIAFIWRLDSAAPGTKLLALRERLRSGMNRRMRCIYIFFCVLIAVFLPPCECSVRIDAHAIVPPACSRSRAPCSRRRAQPLWGVFQPICAQQLNLRRSLHTAGSGAPQQLECFVSRQAPAPHQQRCEQSSRAPDTGGAVYGNVAAGIQLGFNKVDSSLQINH